MSLSKAISSTQQCLEPICLIDLNDPKVNGIDILGELLKTVNPECKLVCISIAGRRREGKSSLLCFFIRYLEARCGTERRTDVWMEHAMDEELGGFPVEHGTESVTRGILIWPKLFKIEENVAVLLMDTQGLFDDKFTPQQETKLISLSLLLSSVQIFNTIGNLDRDFIDYLDIFTRVAGLESSDQAAHPPPFQKLIILLRDWANPGKNYFGWMGGQNILKASRDGALKSKWDKIAAYFEEEIQCFLMPRAGDRTIEGGSKKIADMRDDFRDKVREFIEEIFRPSNLRPMKINGEEITCKEFADFTKRCIGKVESGKFPTVRDVVSSVASDQINELVGTLEKEHRNTISRLVGKGPFDFASLETHLENMSREILEKFDSARKISVAEITESARQALAEAIRFQNETLKTTNAAALDERVKTEAAVGGALGAVGGAAVGAVGGAVVGGPAGFVAGATMGAAGGAGIGGGAGAAVGYFRPLAKVPDENSTTNDSRVPFAEWKEADKEAEITERGRQTLAAAIRSQNETFKTTNAEAFGVRVVPTAVVAAIAGLAVGSPGFAVGAMRAAVAQAWPLAEVPGENSTTNNDDSRVPFAE